MEPLGTLKILSYRELKLVIENLFEGIQIILLIEYKHGLTNLEFIIQRWSGL